MHDDQTFSSSVPDQEPDSPPIPEETSPSAPPEPVFSIPQEIQAIQDRMTTDVPEEKPADFDFAPPSEELQLRIQESLQLLGHYPGKLNGKWGPLSIFGIQTVVAPQADPAWRKTRVATRPDRELCLLVRRVTGYTTENANLDETAWTDFADWLEDGAE